jgi:hypothetical protein
MSDLWQSREQALTALADNAPEVLAVLNDLFALIDDCAEALHRVDSPFGRVTALMVVKARNLAQGCYSLTLDSLAQEGGALFRPLVEAIELLTYFRLDPSRVEKALGVGLPKAGEVAKRIDGRFKELRGYLNAHASHLSLAPEALRHLLDLNLQEVHIKQTFRLPVVLRNLQTLFATFLLLGVEAVNCVTVARNEVQHNLADRIETLKAHGLPVFEEAIRKAKA